MSIRERAKTKIKALEKILDKYHAALLESDMRAVREAEIDCRNEHVCTIEEAAERLDDLRISLENSIEADSIDRSGLTLKAVHTSTAEGWDFTDVRMTTDQLGNIHYQQIWEHEHSGTFWATQTMQCPRTGTRQGTNLTGELTADETTPLRATRVKRIREWMPIDTWETEPTL